jgi:hypothetical protein
MPCHRESEILTAMLKQDLIKCLLKDSKIRTDIQIVANTYTNISFDALTKKLSLLNAIINKKLFKYYQKHPEKRVAFYCNHESVPDNTHSHILLSVPEEYNNIIHKILLKLQSKFMLLDDRKLSHAPFKIFYKTNVRSRYANVAYATKRYNEEQLTHVVI